MSELKPEFEEKLRKAKALTKWKKNFNDHHPEAKKDYGYCNDATSFRLFIYMSYVWMETPEGHDFWDKISNL